MEVDQSYVMTILVICLLLIQNVSSKPTKNFVQLEKIIDDVMNEQSDSSLADVRTEKQLESNEKSFSGMTRASSNDENDDANGVSAQTILSRQRRSTNCCVKSASMDFKRDREPRQLLKLQCKNKDGEVLKRVRVKYREGRNVYRVVTEMMVVACVCL